MNLKKPKIVKATGAGQQASGGKTENIVWLILSFREV